MSFTRKPRAYGVVVLAVCTALGLLVRPLAGVATGQAAREAEGARLLKGAIDMHFHMEVISLIVKHNLVLASGHVLAEDALIVFREARRQGVQHMIATHAMDLAGKMTIPQMQEAAKTGAMIEFDYRNVFDDGGMRLDAIHAIGPEHCLISEFWTNKPGTTPREYAGLAGAGDWVAAMHKRGFTDRDLDVMVKENPARLLGLPAQ
jgi:hypothetical protein